jgi:hypothetical protein
MVETYTILQTDYDDYNEYSECSENNYYGDA